MSPTKKALGRKARLAPKQPAWRLTLAAKLVWMTAGAAMVAVLALAGLLFLQSARPTEAKMRVAPDARVGESHTFYSPT